MAATAAGERLTLAEARGVQLAAQGLFDPPAPAPDLAALASVIDRLGVVQVDTINVVRRSQYLVPWSRLGAYDDSLLDALLFPHRVVFEYWSHAASIVPMRDYPYYRAEMVRAAEGHMWEGLRRWKDQNPEAIALVRERIREQGPLASADFERDPSAQRASAWDWYGPKESRKALDVLWTLGELVVHSRRGGQKVYDLRERMLQEAFGTVPGDDALPSPEEQLDYFIQRTVGALGVLTPSWLWDYFRLGDYDHLSENGKRSSRRASAAKLLQGLAREGALVPARVEGVEEPAYVVAERMADLARLRGGEEPMRTTLLSPFDNLIWHRARTRTLFDYEVCFEAYVLPEKRRYGYYCLAILHRGRLVGRIDPKMERDTGRLLVRSAYLEPGVAVDESLLDGLAGALRDLARFLGATSIAVGRSEPEGLAPRLHERVAGSPRQRGRTRRSEAKPAGAKRVRAKRVAVEAVAGQGGVGIPAQDDGRRARAGG